MTTPADVRNSAWELANAVSGLVDGALRERDEMIVFLINEMGRDTPLFSRGYYVERARELDIEIPDHGARLARNRSGNFIHRAGCVRLGPHAVGWLWAEKNPTEDWRTTAPWLKPCKVCRPPSPLEGADA